MIWEKLNPKNRCIAILAATLILLIISFALPIKQTILTVSSCNLLNEKINDAKNAPQEIAELENIIGSWRNEMVTDLDVETLQLKLFEKIGTIADVFNVQIRCIKPLIVKSEADISVQSFEVVIAGSFQQQVKVLNALESELKYGRVTSVGFYLKKSKENNNEELQTFILIQSAVKQKANS